MTILHQLSEKGLISPPEYVLDNLVLLSIGGSVSYGVSTDLSDMDIIGVFIPPIEHVYPKRIHGFDAPFNDKLMDYTKHHVKDGDQEYDFSIYSVIKLFKLAEGGNPNILDFMLGPQDCELFCSVYGRKIKDFAPAFLSKKSFPKYFGFAESHLTSMQNRNISGQYPGKRKILYDKFGYDTKDGAHIIRSLLSLKDMLLTGNYNVREHAEEVKAIRNGKYTFDEIRNLKVAMEIELKEISKQSSLQAEPDYDLIRETLKDMVETYNNPWCGYKG